MAKKAVPSSTDPPSSPRRRRKLGGPKPRPPEAPRWVLVPSYMPGTRSGLAALVRLISLSPWNFERIRWRVGFAPCVIPSARASGTCRKRSVARRDQAGPAREGAAA